MIINEDHRLCFDNGTPVDYVHSPNFGRIVERYERDQRDYLVMHYTAGSNAGSAIETLTNPQKEVSAHLVIGRDGQITQLVPFNRVANHAGYSYWEGKKYLNQYSIGIELDNDGFLEQDGEQWKAYATKKIYPREMIHEEKGWKPPWYQFWLKYPEEQIGAALEAATAIVKYYRLIDVLGHDDVQPAKHDPGPAFPMEDFREKLFLRKEARFKLHHAGRDLKVYKDGDDELGFESGKPPRLPPLHRFQRLPKDMPVKKITIRQDWALISVKKKDLLDHNILTSKNIEAWIFNKYIQNKKTTQDVYIYKNTGTAPGLLHPLNMDGPIPADTTIRVLYRIKKWALVRTVPPHKFVQGWVEDKFVLPM